MKHCVIVLDGAEKTDALRREIAKDDVVVAVDRGLDACFTLDRPPGVAILGDGNSSDRAMDWAAFSGVEREDYRPRDGASGFELALEWALTSDGIGSVDVINAFGRSVADDASRLLIFTHPRGTEMPLSILTPTQRITVLSGGYTLNGKAGLEFSLVPLDAGSGVTVKNGKHDASHAKLSPGSGVLLRQKLDGATANLQVTAGRFLTYLPR